MRGYNFQILGLIKIEKPHGSGFIFGDISLKVMKGKDKKK